MGIDQRNAKDVSEILCILSDLKTEIRQRYKSEIKGIFVVFKM